MLGALKDAGRKLRGALPKEQKSKGTRIHYRDKPIPDWLTENTDESALKYGGQFRELVPNPEYEGVERQAFGQSDPMATTGTGYVKSGNRLRTGIYDDLNIRGIDLSDEQIREGEGVSPEAYYTDPKSGITYARQDTASLKERNILPKEAIPSSPETIQKNKELIARIHTERAMKENKVSPDDYFPGDQMTGKQIYDQVKKQALERMASPDYDISQLIKGIKKQNPRQQFYSNRKMYKPPTGQ
jgi:hypothetical protein